MEGDEPMRFWDLSVPLFPGPAPPGDSEGKTDHLHYSLIAPVAVGKPTNNGYHKYRAQASLGTHEHWNNAAKKQYSRNLGLPQGIELISVPDTLIGSDGPEITTSEQWHKDKRAPEENMSGLQAATETEFVTPSVLRESEKFMISSVITLSFDGAFTASHFYSVVVDTDNIKWFLTDAGLVSFDGEEWNIHNENRKIPARDLKAIAFDSSEFGKELWLASPLGATVASIPVDGRSGATTYYSDNSTIISENVLSVAVGKGSLRWFGTDKGISAFQHDTWLTPAYQRKYPEYMFQDFPITAMATSPGGDSLYVATKGGVSIFENDSLKSISEEDGLSSNNILCISVDKEGVVWLGTDAGVTSYSEGEFTNYAQ